MNAKVAKPGSPDEQPHDAYTEKVVCKYVVGPGRKQCGSVRYVKKQDVHQVRYCRNHTAQSKSERRSAAKRAAKAAKS